MNLFLENRLPDDLELRARIRNWNDPAGSPSECVLLSGGQSVPVDAGSPSAQAVLDRQEGDQRWQLQLSLTAVTPDSYNQMDIPVPEPAGRMQEVDPPVFAVAGELSLKCLEGMAGQVSVELVLVHRRWSARHYLMMPAGAYQGNRFKAIHMPYPPMLQPGMGIGPHMEPIISDVPRLSDSPGPSCLELTSADLATPLFAWLEPASDPDDDDVPGTNQPLAAFLMTEQANDWGHFGMTVSESDDRTEAEMTISSPAMRRQYHYTIASTRQPSQDQPADLAPGQALAIPFQLHLFAADGIPAFYRQFIQVRKIMPDRRSWPERLPFSEGLRLIMEQHNRESWAASDGFYRLAPNDSPYTYWQAGWCGGGMNSYPMLVAGDPVSQDRAQSTMAFIFDRMQVPTGFFISTATPESLRGDDFLHPEKVEIVLLRKMTDLIYFLLKQFAWLKRQPGQAGWLTVYEPGLRRSCQALVDLWACEGQWGQFIDILQNKVLIGGTAGPASGLAALVLAGRYFGEPAFLETACQAGEAYYQAFTLRGLTNGGPGEIAQCPDSESAFALLEGYVLLAETTGDKRWTERALDAARQCASWCVTYDYRFPVSSEFGRLDMRTTGSVYANVQNKHAAPGICTFSGDSLFRLYRLSGDFFCLDLLRDIAHNIMQYLSRADRPVLSWDRPPQRLNPGIMSERVNLSDWEGTDHVGGVFNGQCWCAVSAMLTAIEVPGVYCQPDTGLVWCADHVSAKLISKNDGTFELVLRNPTAWPARVRVFVEESRHMGEPLGVQAVPGCPLVLVPAGGQTVWPVSSDPV